MSELTTMLAWLIPCMLIFIAFIAYRIYIVRTRGTILPSYLQRNVFARTNSFIPRTIPDPKSDAIIPSTALRNETAIDMSSVSRPSAVAATSSPASVFTPVPCERKQASPVLAQDTLAPSPDQQTPEPKAVSPAISRLLSMK